jgi:pyruvate/oxaloacetate carboxyltransferase
MTILCIKLYCIFKNKTDLCYTLLNTPVTQQTKLDRVTKVIQGNRHATIILGAYESCKGHFVRSVVSAISRQKRQTVFNN